MTKIVEEFYDSLHCDLHRSLSAHHGAGLETLLDVLEDFHFSSEDLAFLQEQGFDQSFLAYLEDFSFKGTIHSAPEGDLIFPTRLTLQVEANIIEAQIIESLVLNILNFQSLIATKASRMRQVAGDRQLLDFGLRRAQGPGSFYASRAAIVGGFNSTSHVQAAKEWGLPVSGTMAHSYVQSFDDELKAFRHFVDEWPDRAVLLIDTYDTLKSGLPNAIQVAKEMEDKGQKLKGVRIDSGDLAYLSLKAREQLDQAGFSYVKIAASNQLDENVIKSLLDQGAPIDAFGVGTNLVVGRPDAALDGVYKLVSINDRPSIKVSENLEKMTLPGKKQVYRQLKAGLEDEFEGAEVVAFRKEDELSVMHHPFESFKSLELSTHELEPVFFKVMEDGKRTQKKRNVAEVSAFRVKQLKKLPNEFKRLENPHIYKVGLSENVYEERNKLYNEYKRRQR